MTKILQNIQENLTQVYALPGGQDIAQFLIDFQTLQHFLPHQPLNSEVHEQVILHCNDDESVDLGIYFHNSVLENLTHHCPEIAITEKNWPDFLTAVEGTSHFLCVDFKTHQSHPVSHLELELQAEIDKFIAGFFYQLKNHDDFYQLGLILLERIFHQYKLAAHLPELDRQRYDAASNAAEKVCHFLAKKFLRNEPDWPGLFQFLRNFYRQGPEEKFSTIHCLCI